MTERVLFVDGNHGSGLCYQALPRGATLFFSGDSGNLFEGAGFLLGHHIMKRLEIPREIAQRERETKTRRQQRNIAPR